ncbi:hypothetical protein C1637_13040 [Chryseobacterium lactis]|uniref:Uncharacterized protein n=1 Tax=Chryseobacterium lactis TaxID=1241981 RepID=A0A3G6RKS3_CHRLC|nr:hypothetical protein EG342_00900 [Chryseobacterium lactis]AZB05561.1 hypothetical protein EG341_17025 [Chryseobacterium lactis]PNW13720.1 hypothetical protein C1637_13040 [Chryseobacterium lactis]
MQCYFQLIVGKDRKGGSLWEVIIKKMPHERIRVAAGGKLPKSAKEQIYFVYSENERGTHTRGDFAQCFFNSIIFL